MKKWWMAMLTFGVAALFFATPVKANNEISMSQYQQVQNQLNAMTMLVAQYSLPGLYDPTSAAVEQALNEELIKMQMLNGTLNPTLGNISQSTTNTVNQAIKDQQQHVLALFAWQPAQVINQALAVKQQEMMLEFQKQQAAMIDLQLQMLGLK